MRVEAKQLVQKKFKMLNKTRELLARAKSFIKQNGIFLLITVFVAAGLKYHYSRACSDDLFWILGPTADLAGLISGVPFENEAHSGFISRDCNIIIAPACAGVNFLIIAFCMAVFAGIPPLKSARLKFLWLGISAAGAYLLTLIVNALRIAVSVYLYRAEIYGGSITPQRVHRLAGTLIYFFFLCLFYRIIEKVIHHDHGNAAVQGKNLAEQEIDTGSQGRMATARATNRVKDIFSLPETCRWVLGGLIPFFWYSLVTLVIPLVNAAYRGNEARFAEHSRAVLSGCLVIWILTLIFHLAWKRSKDHRK